MGYQPLGETIRVSLDIVQERIQVLGVSLPTGLTAHKMFQSFCVIKKRSYMSTVWLKWIWRFDSVAELRDVLLCFQQISLLDITWGDLTLMDLWQTVRVEGIRVHDLVLDYVHSDVDGKCEEVNWPEEILMSLLSEFIGPNTCREMTRTREFNLLPWYENEDVWEDILLFIKPIPDCYQFEYSYYEPAKGHAFKNAITCSYINALEFVMKNRSKKITSGKSKAEIHDLINRLSKRSMKLQKQIDSMGNTLLTLSELLYEDDDPEVLALLSSSHEGERVVKLSKMRIQFLEDGLKTM